MLKIFGFLELSFSEIFSRSSISFSARNISGRFSTGVSSKSGRCISFSEISLGFGGFLSLGSFFFVGSCSGLDVSLGLNRSNKDCFRLLKIFGFLELSFLGGFFRSSISFAISCFARYISEGLANGVFFKFGKDIFPGVSFNLGGFFSGGSCSGLNVSLGLNKSNNDFFILLKIFGFSELSFSGVSFSFGGFLSLGSFFFVGSCSGLNVSLGLNKSNNDFFILLKIFGFLAGLGTASVSEVFFRNSCFLTFGFFSFVRFNDSCSNCSNPKSSAVFSFFCFVLDSFLINSVKSNFFSNFSSVIPGNGGGGGIIASSWLDFLKNIITPLFYILVNLVFKYLFVLVFL